MGCFSCLTITRAATIPVSAICDLKASVGGFKALYNIFCGVQMKTSVAGQDPVAAFLAGTPMPLNAQAQAIAVNNGAPAGTTEATFQDAVTWGLVGTFGDAIRGEVAHKETITHQGGSCEMPEVVNNVFEAMFTQTKVGRAGTTPDLAHFIAFTRNIKAYHLVAVECGSPFGAIFLPSGSYTKSTYKFTRPQDGIKEFTSRSFGFDMVQEFEPQSYAFPIQEEVAANFI